MAQIPTTSIRLDPELKEKAGIIFDNLGLTLTAAINVFLKAVIREQGMPFDMKLVEK